LYIQEDSYVQVINCTIVSNESDEYGGIYNVDVDGVNVVNSIFWDNTGEDIYTNAIGIEVSVEYSTVQDGYDGVGNTSANPIFFNMVGGDLMLQFGSGAIDSGNGNFAPEFDIEGNPRFDHPDMDNTGIGSPSYSDMGAYENHGYN